MNDAKEKQIWREPAFVVGIVLTVLVLGGFAYTLFCLPVIESDQSYFNKWSYLKSASPNELGDTLAGVAGTLAFIWIVVTVWLQATELSEQRKELQEQRKATQEMAVIQSRQVEISEQHEAGEHIEQLLVELRRILRQELDKTQGLVWDYEVDALKYPALGDTAKVSMKRVKSGSSDPEFFSEVTDAVLYTVALLERYEEDGKRVREPSGLHYKMMGSQSTSLKILMKERQASPAKKQRLKNLGFFELEREINRFNSGSWWSEE